MNKKDKIKQIVCSLTFTLSLVLVFCLMRYVCSDKLEGFLWGLAINMLIAGQTASLFLISKKNRIGRGSKFFIGGIVFTAIGIGLLIANSFLFIDNYFISILLIVATLFIISSQILIQHLIVRDKSDE